MLDYWSLCFKSIIQQDRLFVKVPLERKIPGIHSVKEMRLSLGMSIAGKETCRVLVLLTLFFERKLANGGPLAFAPLRCKKICFL